MDEELITDLAERSNVPQDFVEKSIELAYQFRQTVGGYELAEVGAAIGVFIEISLSDPDDPTDEDFVFSLIDSLQAIIRLHSPGH